MGSEVPHVVISVREETQEQTPHADPQSYLYFLYLMIPINGLMILLLIVGPHVIQNKDQSPFKAHGGLFIIMAIASLSMVFLASGILIFAILFLQRWMKNIHYTVLKSIGVLSAHIAIFSVMAVILVPHNLNLIADSVISIAILVTLVTYYFVWKCICRFHAQLKGKGYVLHWTVFVAMLAFLFIALQKYLPPNLHWAQTPIICVSWSFVAVIVVIHAISILYYIREDKNINSEVRVPRYLINFSNKT